MSMVVKRGSLLVDSGSFLVVRDSVSAMPDFGMIISTGVIATLLDDNFAQHGVVLLRVG